MKTPKHSLRKIVTFLNNADEDGGFWLPNIQRPFVWSEEQICRMFDSIMREYPIGTLLVWKTRDEIRCRQFIANFLRDHVNRLSEFDQPVNKKKKCLVLDGQQRLQGLFIGLCGSYEKRELYLDVLSGEVTAPDDVKYKFAFHEPSVTAFPWVKFKDLVFGSKTVLQLVREVIATAGQELSDADQEKIAKHIDQAHKTFRSDDGIAYQELDSIENEGLYTQEEVVEIFIRANSGGTKLGKSDLLFSLLVAGWEDAGASIEELLSTLRGHEFALPRDFVLKTCLALLGKGASYNIAKFREDGVRELIQENWDAISGAILDVIDFVRGRTFIRSDKALPTVMPLIPLVYARYRFPAAWKTVKDVDRFLLRALLSGAFGNYADQLIDQCIEAIDAREGLNADDLFAAVRAQGKSLEITESQLWEMGYGSNAIHLLFSLWYRDFNYTPVFRGNAPQIDHIFPQSALKKVKGKNPVTGKMNVMRYQQPERDQLANCMLLTQTENGGGGKSDTPPDVWFADKSPDYLTLHLIPTDQSLWKLDRFPDFIEARKALIRERFADLLTPATTAAGR